MIGIIKDEDSVIFQFNPIYASGFKRWLQLSIPYSPKNYGEYGISWSLNGWKSLPDVWISWGMMGYTSFGAFYRGVLNGVS